MIKKTEHLKLSCFYTVCGLWMNNGAAHSCLWLLYILSTTRWRCFRQSWCIESLLGTIREKHRSFERLRFSISAKCGYLNAVQT